MKKLGKEMIGILQAIGVALLIHAFLFQPYYVPSGSMKPTLLIGDYMIVNKMAYGYSKYSCYFDICPFSGRILGKLPQRGDVVVFSNPGTPNHNRDYIKRLVGLPGDEIEIRSGVLFINGEEVPRIEELPYAEKLTDHMPEKGCIRKDEEFCWLQTFTETLPNGVNYQTFNQTDSGRADNMSKISIPEDHFFFMGDNRDNSNDSRLDVGLVPFERLVGRAEIIVFSSSGSSLFKFWKWRSDRYFERVE